ncbi:hypothetical protein F5Y09DRAFT_300682 [Xylaria sp. FL1042]|nr:hypothetical protein F5Y09DRAFT_300682 [Xylaria sp. FL1042]
MDLKTATTRLRRTFAYPSDATTTSPSSSSPHDSDSDGPALDEQEQEDLIRSLTQQNAARNAQFRLFLLALPAISTLPYLLVLFGGLSTLISRDGSRNHTGDSGGGEGGGGEDGGVKGRRSPAIDIWIALLALSSLASTAWTLWSLPPGVTGIRALDAWVGSTNSFSSFSSSSPSQQQRHQPQQGLLGPIGANAQRRRRASAAGSRFFFFWAQHHRSPLQQYLPFLNIALCTLLVLTGILSSQRSAASQRWGHVGLANLPALIYVVVLVAKMLMGSIDPEKELSALRYEYKGA